MLTQQLVDFIREQMTSGKTDEDIQQTLVLHGWNEQEVIEAIKIAKDPNVVVNPVQPAYTPSSFTTPRNPKPSKKLLWIILITLGALLLCGGLIFGYFYYFQSPEKILQKTSERSASINALEFQGALNIDVYSMGNESESWNNPLFSPQSISNANFSVDFSGAADNIDANNPKGYYKFNLKAGGQTQAISASASILDVEMRVINKIVYTKLNTSMLAAFTTSTSSPALSLLNNWIRIDPNELKDMNAPFGTGQTFNTTQGMGSLSQDQLDKINKIVSEAKIYKNIEKLADEQIDGQSVYHLKMLIDGAELKRSIKEIAIVTQGLTADQTQYFNSMLDEIELNFDENEIWISKKDFLPRKIILGLIMGSKDNPSEPSGKISLEIVFSNFNKPVQVDIPQQSIPFMEAFGTLLMEISNQRAPLAASDARIKADIAQTRDLAQMEYIDHGSFMSVCKKSTLNTAISELLSINADISDSGGAAVCYASATKYCIYSVLKKDPTQYFCVDSSGRAMQYTSVPKCSATKISCE